MTTNQNESWTISASDKALIQNIIHTTAKRGAFEASELSTVGALYDRLLRIQSNVDPQQKQLLTEYAENTSNVVPEQFEFDFGDKQ